MIQFSLFGIPIKIQPYFWLTMAIIGGAFGADSLTEIFRLALFVIAGLISILVHELGHALTIKAFGVPTAITLQAFGGYASYPSGRLNRKQSFVVTAAGPLIQLALAALVLVPLFLWTSKFLPGQKLTSIVPVIGFFFHDYLLSSDYHAGFFLVTLFGVSVFWACLNLVPVLPLDGGQLVNALLGPARIKITLWLTIIVGLGGGIALFYYTRMLLFPILLGSFAVQAIQALRETRWR